jgi:hypothetical protein
MAQIWACTPLIKLSDENAEKDFLNQQSCPMD